MTEDELKPLTDHTPPPPRSGAKAAALAAAMAAFDAAGATFAKNSSAEAQGNEPASRLKPVSEPRRRQKMRAPVLYKIAAGIAVVVVATPAALYFAKPERFGESYVSHDTGRVATTRRETSPADRPAAESAFPPGNKLINDGLPGQQTGGDIANTPPPPVPQKNILEERIQDALRSGPDSSASARPVAPPPAGGSTVAGGVPADLKGQPDKTARPNDQAVPDGKKLAFDRLSLGNTKDGVVPPQAIAKEMGDKALEGRTQNRRQDARPEPRVAQAQPPAKPSITIPATLSEADDASVPQERKEHRDTFEAPAPNPVKQVAAEPVSTFSVDVDTASYAFVRRALNEGHLPPKAAVRVEEMINYFPYDYPRPETAETPFQSTVTVMPAPWKPTNKLIHIGIKGYDIVPTERPRANLVFLIDISGSMQPADRLPLVKNAFRLLLDELRPDDSVGIVTYASGSGVALVPTRVAEKGKILAAIDALGAGGSTAGAAGIADAYRLAESHIDKAGVNRIILATDGDFNVGISNSQELKGFVERKRAAGIFLSILGVGQGNYHDALMQTLAQNGNGTAAYVDTLNEARKVLVDEASSTLFTIAKDVKIQVEFNPAAISEYRLIGYETRALAREDFNNDKVDAGDIGSGHSVTAIYEVTPVGAPKLVDDLRYGQQAAVPATPAQASELGFLKLRYKLPKEDVSKLISLPIGPAQEKPDIAAASEDVRFSVAVAGFGQILRGLPYLGSYGFDDVLALGQRARGTDRFGYRTEFLNLVRLAKSARP
jgi:Ca-activated chloride channel family protein